MGIVGLPNVGKSTLFNVLTKMGIPAENFPFCTIEPNQVGSLLAPSKAAVGCRVLVPPFDSATVVRPHRRVSTCRMTVSTGF